MSDTDNSFCLVVTHRNWKTEDEFSITLSADGKLSMPEGMTFEEALLLYSYIHAGMTDTDTSAFPFAAATIEKWCGRALIDKGRQSHD